MAQRFQPRSALNGLRTGLEGPEQANQPLALAALRGAREDELARNRDLFADDPYQHHVMSGELGRLRHSMSEDPSTGDAAHEEVADTIGRQRNAAFAGFDSPQSQAQWGRGLKEAEVFNPRAVAGINAGANVNVANINAAGDMRHQRLANEGALAVKRAENEPQAQGLEMFKGFLSGKGLEPGGHVSLPGVGSYTRPREANLTPILKDLDNYRKQGNADGTQQAITTLMGMHPAGEDVKSFAMALAKDPGAIPPRDFDDDEERDIRQLIGYINGKPF